MAAKQIKADQWEVRCRNDKLVSPSTLKAHPDNYNTHPPAQLKAFALIVGQQGWRRPVVVSKLSGCMVAGHGAVLAALENNQTKVPVEYQEFASLEQEVAHLAADNELARRAEVDWESAAKLLDKLGDDDRWMSGFAPEDLENLQQATWQPGSGSTTLPTPPGQDGDGDGDHDTNARFVRFTDEKDVAAFDKAIAKARRALVSDEASEPEAMIAICREFTKRKPRSK